MPELLELLRFRKRYATVALTRRITKQGDEKHSLQEESYFKEIGIALHDTNFTINVARQHVSIYSNNVLLGFHYELLQRQSMA